MTATKRWVYRIGDLANQSRHIQPGVTITRRGGNGINNLPRTGKRRKPFGGR